MIEFRGWETQDLHLATWRFKRADGLVSGRQPDSKSFFLAFYFLQVLNRLEEAYPHWGGQSALLWLKC